MIAARSFCLALAALGLATATASADKPTPPVELVLPESVFQQLLNVATPFDQTMEHDLGMAGKVTVTITLSDPDLRISRNGVTLKMKYHARDANKLIDVTGTASPTVDIKVLLKEGQLEMRFVKFALTLPGGMAVELASYLQPFYLPSVWSNTIDLGGKQIAVETRANKVTYEHKQLRLFADVSFVPVTAKVSKKSSKKSSKKKSK